MPASGVPGAFAIMVCIPLGILDPPIIIFLLEQPRCRSFSPTKCNKSMIEGFSP